MGCRGEWRGLGEEGVKTLARTFTEPPTSCQVCQVSKYSFTPLPAAIAFRGGPFGTDVAVVSQEDSAVWVGSFDWEAMEFVNATDSKMYYFPRGDTCFTVRRSGRCRRRGGIAVRGQQGAAWRALAGAVGPHSLRAALPELP